MHLAEAILSWLWLAVALALFLRQFESLAWAVLGLVGLR